MSAPIKSPKFQQPVVLLGQIFNALKTYYRDHFRDSEPIRVVVFQGHGTLNGKFRISGRVLEGEPHDDLAVDAPLEDNIRDMLARLTSKEISYAQVSCDAALVPVAPEPTHRVKTGEMFEQPSIRVDEIMGDYYSVYCDKEGYFTIEGETRALVKSRKSLWHPIAIHLEWPVRRSQRKTTFVGRCQVPRSPAFGVISDIDDTIMHTGATRIRTMLKTTFSDNARSRRPFTGVVPFYQALHKGTKGHPNPFFYVSSSPWTLYDFLVSFLDFHHLPQGTLYLRDVAIGRKKGNVHRHEQHKLNAIDSIMTLHKDMKFILVGDSGQKDPAIYAKVVSKYPDRVMAIMIRDVTGTHRHAELERLSRNIERHFDIPVLLEASMNWPAHYAARRGWIQPSAVRRVEQAIYLNETEPEINISRRILRRSTRNILLVGALCGAALASWYFMRKGDRKRNPLGLP